MNVGDLNFIIPMGLKLIEISTDAWKMKSGYDSVDSPSFLRFTFKTSIL